MQDTLVTKITVVIVIMVTTAMATVVTRATTVITTLCQVPLGVAAAVPSGHPVYPLSANA